MDGLVLLLYNKSSNIKLIQEFVNCVGLIEYKDDYRQMIQFRDSQDNFYQLSLAQLSLSLCSLFYLMMSYVMRAYFMTMVRFRIVPWALKSGRSWP